LSQERTQRLSIIWSPSARADLRTIDRQTAVDILHCTDRYLLTRVGNVKKLKSPQTGFRLKCGDYRLIFEFRGDASIEILAVRNRKEAYR